MWYFTISEPHKEPKLVSLNPGKHVVGRSWNNDINIEDNTASRQHAQVFVDLTNNTVTIIDLNSKNGIYVNGERIQGVFPLAVKDEILIGKTSMSLAYSRREKSAMKEGAFRTDSFRPKLAPEPADRYKYPFSLTHSLWDS